MGGGFYYQQAAFWANEAAAIVQQFRLNGLYERDARGDQTARVRLDDLNRLFDAAQQAANYLKLDAQSR